MIEVFIFTVALIVFGVAACVIMCAFCHFVPILCIALGLCADRWNAHGMSSGASYSPVHEDYRESDPQNTGVATADAYILPPLEVHDGIYVVTGSDSTVTAEESSKEQYQVSGQTSTLTSPYDNGVQHHQLESGNIHDGVDPDDSTHHIIYTGLLDLGIFKDTFASLIFLANCCVLVILATRAIYYMGRMDDAHLESSMPNSSDNDGINSEDERAFAETMPAALGAYCLVALFATMLTCSVYLALLMKYASGIISASLLSSIIFFAAAGVIALLSGGIFLAFFAFIAAALSYCWLKTAQSRIEFSSIILKTAVLAVKDNLCSLISASLFLQVIQGMYMLTWTLAVGYWVYSSHHSPQDHTSSGSFSSGRKLISAVHTLLYSERQTQDHAPHPYPTGYSRVHDVTDHSIKDDDIFGDSSTNGRKDDGKGDLDGLMIFYFVLSLYWGIQVFRNVVTSTVSGTMACWWFTPKRKIIVAGALFRAFTTSFGTICLGSLIVSIVQALRSLIESFRNRALGRRSERIGVTISCTLCVSNFLLRILVAIISFVNKYAFVYSAAYGTNFATSGARVWELFKKRGWTQIVSDNLISNTLGLGVFATACVTSLFAYLTSFLFSQDLRDGGVEKPRLGLSVGGFVLGLVIGLLVFNLIDSAVSSVFVFFAEDPKELQRNHPEVHDELCIAWMAMYPTSLNLDSSGRHEAIVAPDAIRIESVTSAEPFDSSPDSGIALSPSLQRQGVCLHTETPSAPMVPAQLPL